MYYNEKGGKEKLLIQFNEFKMEQKFCHIEATIILEQQIIWRDFFQSLKTRIYAKKLGLYYHYGYNHHDPVTYDK